MNSINKEKKRGIRSPLFYVGDKYKLMPQLEKLFPRDIESFYDVFCGGGSASINTNATNYYLNDIDSNIIALHKHLIKKSENMEECIKQMYKIIENYDLSHSEYIISDELKEYKEKFKKTYFARYNKDSYLKLRDDYNKNKNNYDYLYLLLVYGFNHMIRFNKKGEFNLPVGNVDWNKNVTNSLINYANWVVKNNIIISKGLDFEEFVSKNKYKENDFLYFDPPYLITFSDYNKFWNEEEELRLYKLLDRLNAAGIKWGLSNLVKHKGKTNDILLEWSKKYNVFEIESNYISRFDNTKKIDSVEIYVSNYVEEE